nr:hypothetical protein [Sulfitobacter aestuariivivens]
MRWREVIVGALLALVGLWLVLGPGFLLAVPGYAGLLGGAMLIWLGVQRARFRGSDGGLGAVQVDEGQVTYFGPLTGGTASMRELERLSLDRSLFPAHWRLEQPGQPPVLIPVNAEGSDALFDAFASLPGLQTEHMLAELRATPHQAVVIWQKGAARPAGITVH